MTEPQTSESLLPDRRPRPGTKNQNGQAMGPKGLKTRRRLIEATARLIDTVPLRDLRVADIARAAQTSAPTFYLYFNDVSEVALAAIAELTQSTPEILALLMEDWAQGDPQARAIAIVEMHIDFWTAHASLFRIRNLAADEGDQRFRDVRAHSISKMLAAMADRVRAAQEHGWQSRRLQPESIAGVLLAMLERVAAVIDTTNNPPISRQSMIESTAHILADLLGPPPAH